MPYVTVQIAFYDKNGSPMDTHMEIMDDNGLKKMLKNAMAELDARDAKYGKEITFKVRLSEDGAADEDDIEFSLEGDLVDHPAMKRAGFPNGKIKTGRGLVRCEFTQK